MSFNRNHKKYFIYYCIKGMPRTRYIKINIEECDKFENRLQEEEERRK